MKIKKGEGIIRLAARDPRVTGGPRSRFTPLSQHASWAEAIAVRYRQRGVLGSWLERVLLRLRATTLSADSSLKRPAAIQFIPRVTVNLLRPILPQISATRWELRTTIRTERERSLVAPERRPTTALVERVISQSTRREAKISAPPPAPSERGAHASLVENPRRLDQWTARSLDPTPVYRRGKPAPVVTAAGPARLPAVVEAPSPQGERISPRGPGRAREASGPETLPPALMGRITDHVIDAIERRVTARRERRGNR